MLERIKMESILEKKESVEFLPYFPTEARRAKEAIKNYLEVYEKSEVFRKATEFNKNKRTLFSVVGLFPEAGFFWGAGFTKLDSDKKKKELRKIYENELGLKVLDWKDGTQSIINPRSVERVIKNCPIPDLFPDEAERDPVSWVMQNSTKWIEVGESENLSEGDAKKRTARFGILSGYPPHGAYAFYDYSQADKNFIEKKFSKQENSLYHKYVYSNPDNRQFPRQLSSKLSEAVNHKTLTESQTDLIKRRFIPKWQDLWGVFGDGFFDEDKTYFENLRKFSKATGLDLTYQDNLFLK